MKNMVTLMLLLLVGCAAPRPTKYDQRQDGDWNVHAHLENVVIVYVSKGSGLGVNLLDIYSKKKAAGKQHAQGKDATDVVIADSPSGIEVKFKAADKEEEAPPEKTLGTTLQAETYTDNVLPDKESSTERDNSSDESSSSSSSSSEEESKEKSSKEESSKDKSSEESSSKEKYSEEDSSSEKSSEETTTAPAAEKPEPEKKTKEARLLDRTKLRQMLADGVEPCLRVTNDGLCQPVTGDSKRRIERQQRQRLIDILSSGISPAI